VCEKCNQLAQTLFGSIISQGGEKGLHLLIKFDPMPWNSIPSMPGCARLSNVVLSSVKLRVDGRLVDRNGWTGRQLRSKRAIKISAIYSWELQLPGLDGQLDKRRWRVNYGARGTHNVWVTFSFLGGDISPQTSLFSHDYYCYPTFNNSLTKIDRYVSYH
jgi:hypothetical protein